MIAKQKLTQTPTMGIQKRTQIPATAGSILIIITACICVYMGIVCIITALSSFGGFGYGYIGGNNIPLWIAGIIEIIAFPVGLVGGIFALRKQSIGIPIGGGSLLITSGVLSAILGVVDASLISSSTPLEIWGLIAIILSILGIIFVAISKDAFA